MIGPGIEEDAWKEFGMVCWPIIPSAHLQS
jgi:hypothetical protein